MTKFYVIKGFSVISTLRGEKECKYPLIKWPAYQKRQTAEKEMKVESGYSDANTYREKIRWQKVTDRRENVRRFFSPREESHFKVKIFPLYRDFFCSHLDHVSAHVFDVSSFGEVLVTKNKIGGNSWSNFS